MAEELLVEQAAKEVAEEIAQTTSTLPGKVFLILGGALIGAASGYYFGRKRTLERAMREADEEIGRVRDHYLAKERAQTEKKPIHEVMEEHGYTARLQGPDEEIYVKIEPAAADAEAEAADAIAEVVRAEAENSRNVFQHQDEWDYEFEISNRQNDVPFVIHKDEYFGEEKGYDQVTLTYFEGDDVLADSNDTPVDDQDAMVGLGNLSKFGHGSGDPNVVYIRNVELGLEIEVVHSDKKYVEEVHGFSDDGLKHSDRRRARRRRHHDES